MSAERSSLPTPVGGVLSCEAPPAVVDRLWHDHARRRAGVHRTRRTAALALAAAMLIGGSAFALGRATTGHPVTREAAVPDATPRAATRLPEVIAGSDATTRIELDDGSWLEAAPGARLTTQRDDAHEVWLTLEAGSVEIEVEPGALRRWVIESPLARVQVVGTRFSVSIDPPAEGSSDGSVSVAVHHGVVRVLSPWIDDAVAVLAAGESLVVRRTPTLDASEPASVEAAPADVPNRVADALSDDDLDRLFREADALRRAGSPDRALAPLARILSARPHGADGALAAFTMARIYDDALGDRARALASLARARSIGLPEALEVEARARLERLDAPDGEPPRP